MQKQRRPKLTPEEVKARQDYLRDWRGWVQVAVEAAGPTAQLSRKGG